MEPLKMSIITASLMLAIGSLLMVIRKNSSSSQRIFFTYLHVFALVFPFAFYFLFSGCQAFYTGCSKLLPIIYLIGFTGLLSAVIGSLAAPLVFLYIKAKSSRSLKSNDLQKFIETESSLLGVKTPKVYIIDEASPVAFSFSNIRPVIFMSAGLFDILNRREIESVLLHELMHIKSGTSALKFSAFLARLFSPLASFTTFRHELNAEEERADNFSATRQGTTRHLKSAKEKVNSFFSFSIQLRN
ncbi:M48 family metalloprotease [Candidatus Woesearchaeota archaeon]|nr:M48 family metalloprotease [Candidatus Woesearchaeota archaeon]